ncbi:MULTISPECIES: hypothetical protein [Halolactibacillus]|nr:MULTISPECIES: hypothetical protein [Halolactibacillus]
MGEVQLAIDHQGFYKKHRFYAMPEGYHPPGETSQIYKRTL